MTFKEIIALAAGQLGTKTKVYIVLGAIALVISLVALGSAWSHFTIRGLEHKVSELRKTADNKEAIADAKEKEAEQYRLKAERLEGSLAEIQKIARIQDENISIFERDVVSGARRNSADARGIRALESTGDQLCEKLAELGHGCD